jgi:hypothetical protein
MHDLQCLALGVKGSASSRPSVPIRKAPGGKLSVASEAGEAVKFTGGGGSNRRRDTVGTDRAARLPWSLVGTLGVFAAVAYPLARAWRIGLEIRSDRVVIVSYFRSYNVPWPEIESVTLGAGSALASWGDGINVRLRGSNSEILCQASIASRAQRSSMFAASRTFGEPWGVRVRDRPSGKPEAR